MFKFENSWIQELPEDFYQKINPHFFARPELIYFNDDLAKILKIPRQKIAHQQILDIFSGNKVHPSSTPLALAYAGHQFGNFVPQLGDGRAILLGEIIGQKAQRFDIQLKGSGKTKFSRQGDGFATLGSAMRELIIGEALTHLKIPATRILTLCLTNSPVLRQQVFHGAVISRVAQSHLRVGSFEYYACRNNKEGLRRLCDYAIKRHFPQSLRHQNPIINFFENVVKSQAELIAKWQSVGFIHGVMNTDNMLICGQSIDFGPCAFLDEYDVKKVFSAIDHRARYAFGNQAQIAKWNLWILLNCLAQISDKYSDKYGELMAILENFDAEFAKNYYQIMAKKLGFKKQIPQELIDNFLTQLQESRCDYSSSLRYLSANLSSPDKPLLEGERYQKWFLQWQSLLKKDSDSIDEIVERMNGVNPFVIARNHVVEEVISAGNNLDFVPLKNLLNALRNPYGNPYICGAQNNYYSLPPSEDQKVKQTFCGT